jgi:hypothetical protein
MTQEQLRMQMLAGVITESEYNQQSSDYKKFMDIYQLVKSQGELIPKTEGIYLFKGIKAGTTDGGSVKVIKDDNFTIELDYFDKVNYLRGDNNGLDVMLDNLKYL